jgi:hypothetical protein
MKSLNITVPNKFKPRIEYMNISNNNSPPTLNNYGNISTNVSNIIYKLYIFLSNLIILVILIDLSAVVAFIEFIFIKYDIIKLITEHITQNKSNIFHGSVKYLVPYAIILIIASNINRLVNTY